MIHPKIESKKAVFPDVSDEGSWKVGQILHIGKIINHKGESVESLVLEPQGIAHLISAECVHLPDEVCGLAHVLTRVCNDGLLTLNIGVVDPGWKNNLSTPVLNFSSEKRLLQTGQAFIRLSFHGIHSSEGSKGDRKINSTGLDYEREIRARAAGNFGKSFLNIKQLVGKASKKENARFKEAMLKYLPIGAFSLAFFALMVTIGIATIARLSSDSSHAEAIRRLEKKIDNLERQNREISKSEIASPQNRVLNRKKSGGHP